MPPSPPLQFVVCSCYGTVAQKDVLGCLNKREMSKGGSEIGSQPEESREEDGLFASLSTESREMCAYIIAAHRRARQKEGLPSIEGYWFWSFCLLSGNGEVLLSGVPGHEPLPAIPVGFGEGGVFLA